jgi:DNA polymerase
MELPSGRALHYLNVSIDDEVNISKRTGKQYTSHTIHYDGIEHSATVGADGNTAKKKHMWGRVKTYGGKLCENAVQAMARDDLLNSMFLADEMGFDIWGLFHDEVAVEVADTWDGLTLQDLIWCMTSVPDWAPGLLLGAEGYESQVYKKG